MKASYERPLSRADLIALLGHFAGSPYRDRLEQIAAHDAAQREIIDAQAREIALLAAGPEAKAPGHDRIAELESLLRECNAVCLCGCPDSEHEADECGESCGHDDHECIRVAKAVLAYVERLRSTPPPPSDAVREALAEIVEWSAREAPCACNVDSPVECWLCRWHSRATAALAARPAVVDGAEVREAAERLRASLAAERRAEEADEEAEGMQAAFNATLASERAAREKAERELASVTTDRDSWAEQADQRAIEAVEYLGRAEAAEARAERLKFQIEREILFLEEEAATGVSFYEATFTNRAQELRATLAEVGGGGGVKTPEHVYVPSCARCRDEAGKDRAKVPDDDLCAWHTTDALTTLRAENERLRTATEIEREGQRSMARALSEINRLSRLDVAVHLVPSAENERLRAAATEAHAVLTRLADSGLPVPLGAEVDAAKARLAGALSREARP